MQMYPYANGLDTLSPTRLSLVAVCGPIVARIRGDRSGDRAWRPVVGMRPSIRRRAVQRVSVPVIEASWRRRVAEFRPFESSRSCDRAADRVQ